MPKWLSAIIGFFADHWPVVQIGWRWVLSIGGGAMSGWAAWATDALKAYAPFSYVFSFILGACIVALIFSAFGWFRYAVSRASYLNRLTMPTASVDPFQSVFSQKRIDPQFLAEPITRIVDGKTFVNCELIGPGSIVFSGCSFQGKTKVGNCDFVQFEQGLTLNGFQNPIIFQGCTFRDCSMFYLILLIQDRDTFDRSIDPQPRWITPRI